MTKDFIYNLPYTSLEYINYYRGKILNIIINKSYDSYNFFSQFVQYYIQKKYAQYQKGIEDKKRMEEMVI